MAINPIEILKDTIASVAHTVTISSVDSLGGGLYKLNTTNTYYLRTAGKPKTITIEIGDKLKLPRDRVELQIDKRNKARKSNKSDICFSGIWSY